MKHLLLPVAAALISCFAAQATPPEGWTLDWAEEFHGAELDTTVWSLCDRGKADWCNTMSDAPDLVEVRDGLLILKGRVNTDTTTDKSPFLTGGVWTKNRKSFQPGGRIEVRARLHGAKGAWPAIWMLPFDTKNNQWPNGGEIDIMERLNNNHKAYQTVHSHYTYTLKRSENPPHGGIGVIDRDDFNVYAVEIGADSLRFFINDKLTFTYPKVNGGADGQYPYYIPMYLLLDMQLGGNWVGKVDPADLPVTMEIDWVRHYFPTQK